TDTDHYKNAFSVYVSHWRDRQLRFEYVRICLFLPAVMSDPLAKITITVKKANGRKRNLQVARRFEMIASQDAKPPGIIRQGIVHTIFGTEIRDRTLGR